MPRPWAITTAAAQGFEVVWSFGFSYWSVTGNNPYIEQWNRVSISYLWIYIYIYTCTPLFPSNLRKFRVERLGLEMQVPKKGPESCLVFKVQGLRDLKNGPKLMSARYLYSPPI